MTAYKLAVLEILRVCPLLVLVIPETLQCTLEHQTPCNTYKYTYLHDTKCEERSNLPISMDGHEHGLN